MKLMPLTGFDAVRFDIADRIITATVKFVMPKSEKQQAKHEESAKDWFRNDH